MNGKTAAVSMAEQIIGLLDQIDRVHYSQPLSIFNGATLGQHFRHIFDFYDCFVKGLPEMKLDYAARERNPMIEKDPAYANEAFSRLLPYLSELEEERDMSVRAHFDQDKGPLEHTMLKSSVGRELMFICDHAIHHLALIKVGLKWVAPGADLDENLGVAPSTLAYRKGHQAPNDQA